MPGIFIIRLDISVKETVDELILIAYASMESEFADRISFLPAR